MRLFSNAMQTNAAVALEQSPVSTTPTLSAMEEKAANTYKEAIDSGKLKPKSYLGNKFRKAIKGSPEFDRYQAMDRDEANTFRLEWAKQEYDKIIANKTHTRSWQRIDRERGFYKALWTHRARLWRLGV